MWVVSRVHADTIEAISFDSENCSATQRRRKDHDREYTCFCGDDEYHEGTPDPDCETCKGTGRYTKLIVGWDRSEVLATNVKDFILAGFKKAMRI